MKRRMTYWSIQSRAGITAVAFFLGAAQVAAQTSVPATARYQSVASILAPEIERELARKGIPAISIALVDDQQIVWARGFGLAHVKDSVPATAETIHRVGSVSKLFTDIGIMQLVERGQIDLDAPVTRYLPDFKPLNPFGTPITLRQLMSHRAGLLREPPVGNYFDDRGSSLSEMVASLNGRELIYAPTTRLKYSNAAIATVGYVLERLQGRPFADYLKTAVLAPIGMSASAFAPDDQIRKHLAQAVMWSVDGRVYTAPTFELGMAPAGSMYSSVIDLSKFMSMLFAGGTAPSGARVLKPATLEAMWQPQFAAPGASVGGGLGFFISDFQGHRRVGHGGAIYGFATELAALPELKLGVVVVATKDIANVVVERLANHALALMLRARTGEPIAALPAPPRAVPPEDARRLEGKYARDARVIRLVEREGRLFAQLHQGLYGFELLSLRGDTLISDDALSYGTRVRPVAGDRILVDADTFTRVRDTIPPEPPAHWRALIGEYGWDHNTLYIFERAGRLYSLIEWFFLYPLEQISQDVYRFPAYGLYDNEKLVFRRDATGRVREVEAASVVFTRRLREIETGQTFKIKPVRPVEELRREALAATPPVERGEFRQTDLVELRSLDPTIKYDIRYATTNNFMDAVFYSEAKAFLQRPAAEALVRAHTKLRALGYGLLIHDAYRPWYVTRMFWDATPPEHKHFVADPSLGSRHNRGAAVDLTLYDLKTGAPVAMVGGYDEFSERSYPDYPGGTSRQRWHRELLRDAMEAEGFRVYEFEWWHFDYGDWRKYPIGNLTFDRIQ